ncbi:MAG: alpha/beta hydrolase [Frankiales bacterium]|jgi:pimeloyl-ACP methyl ester carboxylesterase|nr:alpha/beta hydrolase [Frankiales bacterium]
MEPVRIPVGGDLVLDAMAGGPTDGPVVVLLHGFPQTSWCWRGVWPALVEAGYRVVAPDQRGYSPGARPDGVEPYAMPHLVADVLALLDALGVDRAHVVGHDWGAAIAWQVAARHPERVRTLTAISVPHPRAFADALRTDPDQRARSQYMRDWQDPEAEIALLDGELEQVFGGIPAVDAARYLAVLREPGVLTRALGYYRAASRRDVEGLGPVSAPTLHVWSDSDPALGPVATHATASHVDGPYRLEVLPGVSHWIPEEAAEALSDLLLEHLAGSS